MQIMVVTPSIKLIGIALITFNIAYGRSNNNKSDRKYQKQTEKPPIKPHSAKANLFLVNFDIPFDMKASAGKITQYAIHQAPKPYIIKTPRLKHTNSRVKSNTGNRIPRMMNKNEMISIPGTNPRTNLKAIRSASNIPNSAILETEILLLSLFTFKVFTNFFII